MNTGLLILRLVFGLLLVGHGSQKLFGKFGGYGLTGTGGWFASVGFRPGKQMAFVAGAAELGGGLLLALGLLTPLAAAIIVGTLVVAASTHLPKGLWASNGGYEIPLLFVTAAAVLGFTGPGAWSLDNALGIQDWSGTTAGIIAVVVGVLGALIVVGRAHAALRNDAPVYPTEAETRDGATV
ncbi:MAG: DoxX family protein [Frankiales bacterium]|jgi:putative oxidoreductase|nr:DoxX family protein [Frankiales bacterium]